MPIVGFNIDKIIAEKKEVKDKINISTNLKIMEVSQEKLQIHKSEDIVKFNFEFDIKYEPKAGSIVIGGHILYLEDPKLIKGIVKSWKKNKTIEPKIMQQLFNTILLRCNIKALELSQEINLPPHLRLPRVETQTKPQNYIS